MLIVARHSEIRRKCTGSPHRDVEDWHSWNLTARMAIERHRLSSAIVGLGPRVRKELEHAHRSALSFGQRPSTAEDVPRHAVDGSIKATGQIRLKGWTAPVSLLTDRLPSAFIGKKRGTSCLVGPSVLLSWSACHSVRR
jgi:hypothetical protein